MIPLKLLKWFIVILFYVYNAGAYTRGSQSPEDSFTVNGFGPCSSHQIQMSWGNSYHALGTIYCIDSISSYCFSSLTWLTHVLLAIVWATMVKDENLTFTVHTQSSVQVIDKLPIKSEYFCLPPYRKKNISPFLYSFSVRSRNPLKGACLDAWVLVIFHRNSQLYGFLGPTIA